MHRVSNRVALGMAVGMLALQAALAHAARPSESLLPGSTKGYISVANVDALHASWNKTQIGQLMQDPVMKPFAEDLKRQIQRKWSQSHQKLGIAWEDLEGVPGGEVAIAVIQPNKKEGALAMVVDITGHEQQANALLEKVAHNLTARHAKRSQKDVYGVKVTIYDVPKTQTEPAAQAVFFIKDDLLVAADNLLVLEGIAGRFAAEPKGNLSSVPAFAGVMKRCQAAAGELAPQVRWFVEPFGYAEVARLATRDQHRRKGHDMLKILRNQGFTAVQGLGGFVNLSVDKFEVLHRTAIYAPPVKPGADKYELAARMLDFPNGGDFAPPSWIPREIASYANFNFNMKKAFESSKTLVNGYVGDPVFEDVLKSILEDPNGPQIDIRSDLVAHLGSRVLMISDYNLPINTKSERMLFAAEVTNPKAIAIAIAKSMKTDPDARRRVFNGHEIWEIVDEQSALPMVTIENNPAFGPSTPAADDTADDEEGKRMLPNSAVTVAHGHLLVATHIDFLTKVLGQADAGEKLATSTDYQIVREELGKLAGSENCAQTFSRTDEEYRAVYELIRAGRMPESETMVGRLLNALLGDGKEGVVRKQRIDGSKLPDFEMVRRYFGPAGMAVTSEQDGWLLTGFTLSKE